MKYVTRREMSLAIVTLVSLLLVVAAGIYTANLHARLQRNDTLLRQNNALLREKDAQSNTSSNYTGTICAEYRKLYQDYVGLRSLNPSAGASSYGSYALPGSAKGEVDQCYQPN